MDMKEKLERIKQLVVKRLTDGLNAQEEEELNNLMQTDIRCKRLAERLLSPSFLRKAILDHNRATLADSWQKLYARIGYRSGIFRSARVWKYIASTAAMLLLVFGGYVWWQSNRAGQPVIRPGITRAEILWPDGKRITSMNDMLSGSFSPASDMQSKDTARAVVLSPNLYTRIAVPQGGEYKVRLDDGTLIHLNAGSTMAIPTDFSARNRRVNLSGEAYLEVAKDSLHPFRIETEKAHVIVLGTKLNVRCYDDEPCMSVTLETGRADLLAANQRQSLPVGHKAVIDSKGNIAVSPADLYVETAWHQGRLAFDNQPMERIMHDLERWYGVQASFSSDEARKARFTLDLDRYDTFNSFMDVVRMIGEVDIALENKNQVLISKK